MYNFYYDETSKSCLRWKSNSFRGWKKQILSAKKDGECGYLSPDGYWKIHLGKGRYGKGHRIVWELLNGKIPENFEIDHLDGDKSNNKITNLRLVTRLLNCRNRPKREDNTSGITGVKFNNKNGNLYWMAKVVIDGKEMVKHFSIKKLGDQFAKQEAISWRESKMREIDGYTERHGK